MEFSMRDVYGSPRPEMDLAWKAMRLLLSQIQTLSSKEGGRLLVAYAAAKEAVIRKDFDSFIKIHGIDSISMGLDWDRPSNRLGEVCADLGVPFIDLNPAFRRFPNQAALFLKRNAHWSAEGHLLAGRTVAAKILSCEGNSRGGPAFPQR
jgi:hypothetical protein